MASEPAQPDRDLLEEESNETVILDAAAPHEAEDKAVAALIEADAPVEEIARGVEEQEPADAADSLETLERADSAEVLREMEDEAASEALSHVDLPLAVTFLSDQTPEYAARLLDLMDPDDAADLLQASPKESTDAILRALPRKTAASLGKLVRYDPETAGGLMTLDFIKVSESETVDGAVERIRRESEEDDTDLYYLYVTDDAGQLRGVVSLRALLLSRRGEHVSDVMNPDTVSLNATLDREEVARAFDRYDHVALPVTDDNERLLGVVTIDDVIDTIRAEQTEDALKQVGAGPSEVVYDTIGSKMKARTPWLVVNLLAAQVGAAVVLLFEDMIATIAVLAVLMPVIANQAGNAGNQSMAVTLRGLVLGEVRKDRVGPLLLRETIFGLLTGAVTGVIAGLAITAFGALGIADVDWRLGVVVTISMSGALAAGCFVGTGIPVLMERLKFDPATASTIFLMMLTDAFSFAAFLGLAFLMRGWLLEGVPVS
jgi:magnesium transporter